MPHAKPTPENPVILLLDGHSSHCTVDIIEAAREHNVMLLALAPHTTHLCQPLDVAVYKSFKMHLSKLMKLGQTLRGDFWVSKGSISKMLKKPFEESMTMQNIKSGFRKCGICPFNPNAIDKGQLFRNKLIPSEDIDLAVPPEEMNSTDPENGSDLANDPIAQTATLSNFHLEQDATLNSTIADINEETAIALANTDTASISQENDDLTIILLQKCLITNKKSCQ